MNMTFKNILSVVLLNFALATLAFASPEPVTTGDSVEAQTEQTATLAASSGKCGDRLTWTLDDEGTLTISGSGEMTDWEDAVSAPWFSLNVEKIVIGGNVTTIGDYAFANSTYLESVEISSSVTTIGYSAFAYSPNLKSVQIPDSVTKIDDFAFNKCTGLESAYIGNGVTSIGASAFFECQSLKNVKMGSNVSKIKNLAFGWCTSLESIEIPSSVTIIDATIFSYCTSLKKVIIPANVTGMSADTFYKCSNVTIYGYENSTAQEYADGSNTEFVTLIGHGSCGEYLLWTLDDEGTLTISGTGAMTYNSSSAPWYSLNSSIKKAVIGSGITSIEKEAFSSCNTLESVTIPDSVTSIGQAAFVNCSSLISVEIPNGVKYIGDWAFMGCGQLKKIVIPPSVTVIEEEAFKICRNLTIYGYAGTYAQTFANTVGKPFVCMLPSFSTSMQAYLNLEDIISMGVGYKFEYMENIHPEDYTDKVGLLMWSAASAPEEEDATYENCTNIIEGAVYNGEMGRFETTTEGIVAKKLGDRLCFRAYFVDADGDYVYSKYITNYSPKTYCYNQIKNNPDDETRIELMASILNYGAAAQKFFKYNTDNLMNSDLPEELQ